MSGVQQETPESDTGSFECFQNYTAPEVFVQGLAGIVDQQDVEAMIRAQKQMLQRFEKTNEMLINCNQLSVNRLKSTGAEFKKHTALLIDMKKDLDYIFKKIRLIKTKLSQQYPQAYNDAVRSSLAEEVIVEDNENELKDAHLESSKKVLEQIEERGSVKSLNKREHSDKRYDSSSTDTENEQIKVDSSSSSDTS